MIFVTVGTQLPFDRLIDAMEAYAAAHPDEEVRAQTGPVAGAAARWPHLSLVGQLSPETFDTTFAEARVVVGHAGIGTILSARTHRRPLILVPRQHALGEHRNDHQIATLRHLTGRPGLYACPDVADLPELLQQSDLSPADAAPKGQGATLIAFLRARIHG